MAAILDLRFSSCHRARSEEQRKSHIFSLFLIRHLNRPSQAVERLWKVNHWLCAHDNVWCTAPDFADIVREAVRRERNHSTSVAMYDMDGKSQELDDIPSTFKFKNVAEENDERPSLSSAELLQMTAGTADWSKLEVGSYEGSLLFL